jgi:hypothetical protein
MREGKIRAQGPFSHAILAGTVGATCFPLMIGLWQLHKRAAVIGIGACLGMVFACASSGPILSILAAGGALLMWRYRGKMRTLCWFAAFGYIALDLAMKQPAYFIMAKIDISGGSTGWHRAFLIQSSLKHISEWWLAGTDYTRHWMPTGVTWNPDHTDITNYYLKMGVLGGLPLMLIFIAVLIRAFIYVGRVLRERQDLSIQESFLVWTLGASLFAHAATSISVVYFDQSFVFLYMTLAAVGSTWSRSAAAYATEGMTPATQPSVDLLPTASDAHALGYPARPTNELRLPW